MTTALLQSKILAAGEWTLLNCSSAVVQFGTGYFAETRELHLHIKIGCKNFATQSVAN